MTIKWQPLDFAVLMIAVAGCAFFIEHFRTFLAGSVKAINLFLRRYPSPSVPPP
jgi:hypothetical protein